MSKLFTYLIISVFIVISLVSADSIKQGNCGQMTDTCTNCTFINITAIHYPSPNSSILYLNKQMTKTNNVYNYSFCDTNLQGTYTYDMLGDPNGILSTNSKTIDVTQTGQPITTTKAILYTVIVCIAIILLAGLAAIGIMLPSKNNSDEMTGYILAVNNLKYVKVLAWVGVYLVAMLIMYFSWIISTAYLDLDFLGSIFNFIFYAMVVTLFPGFILMTYILIANAVRDHKVKEALEQNLRITE